MQRSTVSGLDRREAVRRQQPNLLPELSRSRIFANAQDTGTKTLFHTSSTTEPYAYDDRGYSHNSWCL
jgi:hypothetical protein